MLRQLLLILVPVLFCAAESSEDLTRDLRKSPAARQRVHEHFSTFCFNECWKYIDKKQRTDEDVENMIAAANASLWHWKQRTDCKPANLSVAYWQLGRVHCLAENMALAKRYGAKCVAIGKDNSLPPFYLGYGYEVLADAAAVEQNSPDAKKYLKLAREQLQKVTDKESRKLLEADLRRIEKIISAPADAGSSPRR